MTTTEQRAGLERQREDLGLRVAEGDVAAVEALAGVEDEIDQVRRQDERRAAVARAQARRDTTVREQEHASLIQQLRDLLPRFECKEDPAEEGLTSGSDRCGYSGRRRLPSPEASGETLG